LIEEEVQPEEEEEKEDEEEEEGVQEEEDVQEEEEVQEEEIQEEEEEVAFQQQNMQDDDLLYRYEMLSKKCNMLSKENTKLQSERDQFFQENQKLKKTTIRKCIKSTKKKLFHTYILRENNYF